MRKAWIVTCRKCNATSEMIPDFDEDYREKASCNVCGADIYYKDGKWLMKKHQTSAMEDKQVDLLGIE